MSSAPSLFSSTFSIAPQLVRRNENAAFTQLEEVIEHSAQRHREGKAESARHDISREQEQKSQTAQRKNISETRSNDIERQHRDFSQEQHEARENYFQKREQNANERAARSNTLLPRETFTNERNFSQVNSQANSLAQNLLAAPRAVTPLENSAQAGNGFSNSSARLTTNTTISQNGNFASPRFAQEMQLQSSIATFAPQQTTITTAAQTAQAASIAFTIFNPSGKLRARRDDEKEKTDSEFSEFSEINACGKTVDKSEVANKPLKHTALEIFSTLFSQHKEKENSVASFANFSSASSQLARENQSENLREELEKDAAKKLLLPRDISAPFTTVFLRETQNEKSSTSENETQTTQQESIELIQRVVAALQSSANQSDTVRIRMHPESLGSVAVRVRIQQGKMFASLRVENNSARELLLENLDTLRKRLASGGIEMEEFEVELFTE